MYGYYYKAGKTWEDVKLWEATKDNPQEDINVESFLKQDNYWNIRSFLELAKEMQLVLKADYSYPIILDEEHKLVDGAHRLVHAYLDGKTYIKGVIIKNEQWPEPDYDELKKPIKPEEPKNYKQQVMSEMTNLVKDYIQQKSTWTEEDKKKLTLLIKILEVNHSHGLFKVNSSETMRTEELVSWLKSLKPEL